MLAGERLFQGDSMIAVIYRIAHEDVDLSALPRGTEWERLQGILARALSREREARYPDAQSMAADLQRALRDLGGSLERTLRSDDWLPAPSSVESEAPGPREAQPAPARHAQGRPWKWAVVGAGSTLIVLGGGYFLGVRGRSSTPSPSPPPVASPPNTSIVSAPTSTPVTKPTASPRPSPRVEATGDQPLAKEPTTPPADQLDKASSLLEQGRYASALQEARAVLDREPGNAQARTVAEDAEAALMVETRLKNARDALRRNDREGALAEVRAGLAVNGSDARLLALFRELTQ
jgi:hypothetical protein